MQDPQRRADYKTITGLEGGSMAEKLPSKKRTREEPGERCQDDTDLISQVTRIIQNLSEQGKNKGDKRTSNNSDYMEQNREFTGETGRYRDDNGPDERTYENPAKA